MIWGYHYFWKHPNPWCLQSFKGSPHLIDDGIVHTAPVLFRHGWWLNPQSRHLQQRKHRWHKKCTFTKMQNFSWLPRTLLWPTAHRKHSHVDFTLLSNGRPCAKAEWWGQRRAIGEGNHIDMSAPGHPYILEDIAKRRGKQIPPN